MDNLEPIRFRIENSEIEMTSKRLAATDTRDHGAVNLAEHVGYRMSSVSLVGGCRFGARPGERV